MSIMCIYQDCLSVKYPCSRIAFFRLPNDDRRSTWIRNSGNIALSKIGPKAQRFFCEKHFRERDISSQFNRKLLKRDAVPLEHSSLKSSKQTLEETAGMYADADESIMATSDENNQTESTGLVHDNLEEHNNDYQNLYEELVLDSSTTTTDDTPADASSGVPHRILEFYEVDDEDNATATIVGEKPDEDSTNKVDSSTLDLEEEELEQNEIEIFETLNDDPSRECPIPLKKKRHNEMETTSDELSIRQIVQLPGKLNNTINNSYEEDKHFALSLVGYFQRLPQGKKSLAKLKILQYLTELEMDLPTSL